MGDVFSQIIVSWSNIMQVEKISLTYICNMVTNKVERSALT